MILNWRIFLVMFVIALAMVGCVLIHVPIFGPVQ